MLSHDFDTRDAIAILDSQLTRREMREGALQWLQQHLDELTARRRDDENSWLFGEVAATFCDAVHREAVAALLIRAPIRFRAHGSR